MASAASWLPDRHLSVAATLAHSDDLMQQLADTVFNYITQPEGVIRLRDSQNGITTRTTVGDIAPLPRRISLLTADVLNTLRAAVEHTLYAEIEMRVGAPLSERQARSVEMPAMRRWQDFDEWVQKRKKFAPPPLLEGSPLLERMRDLQPYQRTVESSSHPLALLTAHTNLAKHRMPAVAAVRLAYIRAEEDVVDPRVRIERPSGDPLVAGELIAEAPAGLRVPLSLFPTVGVQRPGTDRWPPLMKEVEQIALWVRTQAVPRLITGSGQPNELPATFDISVGHSNERSVLASGTQTSAGQRFSRRLDAAVTRMGLSDILVDYPDGPPRSRLDAWLAQVDDDSILEWFDSLVVTTDTVTARQNIRIMRHLMNVFAHFERKATAAGGHGDDTEEGATAS